MIELERRWVDFSGAALILHQLKSSFCAAAGRLTSTYSRDGHWMMLGTNLGLLAIAAKMVCRQGGRIVVAEGFVSAWEGQIRRLDCCVSRLGFLPIPSEAVCGWDHTVLIARGSLNNASLAVNSHTLGVQADDNSSFEVKADGYWERSELLPTKRPHLILGNQYYSVEWGCNSPL